MNALFAMEAKRKIALIGLFFRSFARSVAHRLSVRNAAYRRGITSDCVALRHHAVGAASAMR
ncbi:hypothetical protein [Lysobacter hankyongensis]|uniref:hypothetical protein n=1 Tax=Lysobacter hankyongensis TaxID=1176535 RepID=UPI0031E82303